MTKTELDDYLKEGITNQINTFNYEKYYTQIVEKTGRKRIQGKGREVS